jgi:hypothetical protein
MPTTYSVRIRVQASVIAEVVETSTPASGGSAQSVVKSYPGLSYDRTFQSGTGSSQFDRAAAKAVNLAAAAQDLDLSGSTFTTPGGTAWTAAELGILGVVNKSQTSGHLIKVLGDANSVPLLNTAATYMTLGPDSLFLVVNPIDGWTITAGTGDIVQLDPASNTIDADVFVAARSA